jgi:protein-disulfide isomerase
MQPRLLLAAAALAGAALTAPGAAAPAAKAAKPADWSRTVVATPEGGFRMGNPAARVKLIEYGSLTCPHCAAFNMEAKVPLAPKIRSGAVSYEFRTYVLNGIDAAATLLARCAGPVGFFRAADRFYVTQSGWVGKVSGMPEEQKAELRNLPEGQRLVRLAEIGGMLPLAAQAGLPAARAKACLADPAGLRRIGEIGQAAVDLGVQGTPTFFLNGRNIGVHDWASLEPLIRQAGG